MIELRDLTRLPYDSNGNSRHVVHFPTFLTKEENSSCFLLWAGLMYPLALMRAAPVGGSKYNGKSFGGGIKFQAQEGQMQKLAEQAFASFENSKVFKDSRLIKKAVEENAHMRSETKKAVAASVRGALSVSLAFAEVYANCDTAKSEKRIRAASQATWLAAVHLSMELYEEVRKEK